MYDVNPQRGVFIMHPCCPLPKNKSPAEGSSCLHTGGDPASFVEAEVKQPSSKLSRGARKDDREVEIMIFFCGRLLRKF